MWCWGLVRMMKRNTKNLKVNTNFLLRWLLTPTIPSLTNTEFGEKNNCMERNIWAFYAPLF